MDKNMFFPRKRYKGTMKGGDVAENYANEI